MWRHIGATLALALAMALCAGTAMAHGDIPGVTGLPAEILGQFLQPDHVLSLAAATVLAATQTWRTALAVFAIIVAGVLAGTVLRFGAPPNVVTWGLLLAVATVTGIAVAALAVPGRPFALALAAFAGVALGHNSIPHEPGFAALSQSAAGAAFAAVIVLAPSLVPYRLRQSHPGRIGLRILGSWTAAISVMVLVFVATTL